MTDTRRTHLKLISNSSQHPTDIDARCEWRTTTSRYGLAQLRETRDDGVICEAVRQVALADRIVLNKTDLVSPEALQELTRAIRAINTQALLMETTRARCGCTTLGGSAVSGAYGGTQPTCTLYPVTSVAHSCCRCRGGRVDLDFILDIGAFDPAKHEEQMAQMVAAGQSGHHLDGSVSSEGRRELQRHCVLHRCAPSLHLPDSRHRDGHLLLHRAVGLLA